MEAIDNILHFINRHFDQNLSLNTLAAQAHYSPYHFHRLFRQRVGEAPGQYLQRLRLEKSTKELLFYPDKSIYAISVDCGFSSQSVYARAFKNKYGITAEQYRGKAIETIRQKTEHFHFDAQQYPVTIARPERIFIACELTLLHDGPQIMTAFHNLHQWACARELTGRQPEYFGIFIDSPYTTPLQKCRYLAGIRVSHAVPGKDCQELGGITVAQIPVRGNFEILTDYSLYVKKRWIPDSGYSIIQGIPGYERFMEMDFQKPYAEHLRSICIGIRPA
ncbi:MAG: helix-turn-helix domain-containing protein [Bacteroidetes bacterium]|nr:helix-turn-helix domain-containing protein [Bacteroidota bacterium]